MTQAAQLAQYGANNVGLSFKNRIINGDMTIDQRNNGASGTAIDIYTVDRWKFFSNVSGKGTWQQNLNAVTPPSGFTKYLGFTTTSAYSVAAGDTFGFLQSIEGLNIADFGWGTANAQTVTLSFWVRSSLTGTFGGVFRNNLGNRSYPFTYTISAANTWEQKSLTIAGDTTGAWSTDNTGGIQIWFNLGTGSTFSGTAGAWAANDFRSATGATSVVGTNGATFYITGVQLEKGTVATSFDYLPYTTELQLCQRYYQLIRSGMGLGNTTAQVIMSSGIPVTMRATPSLGQTGVIEMGSGNADRTQSSTGIVFLNGTVDAVCYLLPNYSGLTVTAGYQFRLSANTNAVTLNSEL